MGKYSRVIKNLLTLISTVLVRRFYVH